MCCCAVVLRAQLREKLIAYAGGSFDLTFTAFDTDGDGYIQTGELRNALKVMDVGNVFTRGYVPPPRPHTHAHTHTHTHTPY